MKELLKQIEALATDFGLSIKVNKEFTNDGALDKINLILAADVVTHKSPPKGYPKDKGRYADPTNYKYPIDTESHVRAAWSYINMPKNQKGYSPAQIAAIKSRIKAAGQKFGIDFNDGDK